MRNTATSIFNFVTGALAYIVAFTSTYYVVTFMMQFITWLIMLAGNGLLATTLIWIVAAIPVLALATLVFALSLVAVGAIAVGVHWAFCKCFGSESTTTVDVEEIQPVYATAA